MAVFEAHSPCQPTSACLAAYLAAAEPGTYMHCTHNGDDLLNATAFPEMKYYLGAPAGPAEETRAGSNVWHRAFASGTTVVWDNNRRTGSVAWAKASISLADALR